jgi:hypothetical protein
MPLRLRAGELSSGRIVAAHLIVTLAKTRVHAMSPPVLPGGEMDSRLRGNDGGIFLAPAEELFDIGEL